VYGGNRAGPFLRRCPPPRRRTRPCGGRDQSAGFGPLFEAVSIFRQAAIRPRIRSLSAVGSPRRR